MMVHMDKYGEMGGIYCYPRLGRPQKQTEH